MSSHVPYCKYRTISVVLHLFLIVSLIAKISSTHLNEQISFFDKQFYLHEFRVLIQIKQLFVNVLTLQFVI